ncbi:MAG: Non-reducing end beta-L-arabinofuranosidase [candidate division BRC1 bacterium ADurb.BinA364]|nr:MAG: Non-reducing end beta-L-arabinofuranosidase [candidate division BRC1 bacterium ADurb.BinA364]
MVSDQIQSGVAVADFSASPKARIRSTGMDAVRLDGGFWAKHFERMRDVSLPMLRDLAADPECGHVYDNLRIAAGTKQGEFKGVEWSDEWAYKWIEAAAAIYRTDPSAELDRQMDELIDLIAAAQEPDGYLASQTTSRGRERFIDPNHHECYVMGHLMTAACIHHRATGKANLLDVARRTADHLCEQFKGMNPRMAHFPHNPSMIMGAVELYRTTGERQYLELAATVVDMRGRFNHIKQNFQGDLTQDRVPLREETRIVGHAVFYTYLYAGAADVYLENGDETLLAPLERLWRDLVNTKMYITGGCAAMDKGTSIRPVRKGLDHVHEAAGPAYWLPNAMAYNETCDQIGAFLWAWRMLAISGEARYADAMEREMYNGFLPGVSLDGRLWFYSNALRCHGAAHEERVHPVAQRFQIGFEGRRICCPTNALRTLTEIRGYLYGLTKEGLWLHFYAASEFDSGAWALRQRTDYPWDGAVRLEIRRAPEGEAALFARIPEWAEGASVRVNGMAFEGEATPGAYAAIRRVWKPGDQVELDLPMEARLVKAHPKVEEARGQAAVVRGPLVYCVESPDLPDGVKVENVCLKRGRTWTPRWRADLLDGVMVLEAETPVVRDGDWSDCLYKPLGAESFDTAIVRLIPYYAWANRGLSEMSVWMPLV